MTGPSIIVGMDLSERGERAFAMALFLVRQMGRGTIHIAHAVTQGELSHAGRKLERQDDALSRLPREIWFTIMRLLRKEGTTIEDVEVWQHVRLGAPADVIRQVAVDYDATLVVVGTRGNTGVKKLVLGSVADQLVHDGRFPVLVAHPNRLADITKTELPELPHADDALIQTRPEGAHLYRSSLIDAWKALGRPTSPDFR